MRILSLLLLNILQTSSANPFVEVSGCTVVHRVVGFSFCRHRIGPAFIIKEAIFVSTVPLVVALVYSFVPADYVVY